MQVTLGVATNPPFDSKPDLVGLRLARVQPLRPLVEEYVLRLIREHPLSSRLPNWPQCGIIGGV